MKLQINQRGSWRHVADFPDMPGTFAAIRTSVIPLAQVMSTAAKWRVLDDKQQVVAYLDAPDFKWTLAAG